MRSLTVPIAVFASVIALNACTKSDNPKVAKAGEDMQAAGAATSDAAANVGSATADATKNAAEKTDQAVDKAAADTKAGAKEAARRTNKAASDVKKDLSH